MKTYRSGTLFRGNKRLISTLLIQINYKRYRLVKQLLYSGQKGNKVIDASR